MVSSQTSQSHLELNSQTMTEVSNTNDDTRDSSRPLGKPPAGKHRNVQENENDPMTTLVKGDLKKVSVSPRVELMLNNELFKKYLNKHGNLLEKIAQRQGRSRGTLKKAFSNLDLSKIDLEEELQSTNNLSCSSTPVKEDNKENEIRRKDSECTVSMHSQNPAAIRAKRSLSLTGTSDPNFNDIQIALKLNDEKTNARTKTRRSKFVIPSFEDFKRSQKEKLKKGQEYVKDVLRNKENIPQSFMKNLDKCASTVTSSRRLPKEPSSCESPTQKEMVSTNGISDESVELSATSNNVENSIESKHDRIVHETINHGSRSQERVHRKLPSIEKLTLNDNKSSQQDFHPGGKTQKEDNEGVDNTHATKLVTRKERLKSSESFCTRTPEVSIQSPRRSQSLRTPVRDDKSTPSKSFSEDVDPLELSTDGNTVYATLNIFSTDIELAAHATDTEEEEEQGIRSKSKDKHCNCCIKKTGDICDEDQSSKPASAINPQTVSSPKETNSSNKALVLGNKNGSNSRIILRAARKRKLPTKQRKPKSDVMNQGANKGLPTVRSHPKLTSPLSIDVVTHSREQKLDAKKPQPIHLSLNRSHSCEVFNYNNFSPYSPGTFSFPNSPSDLASFSFPSTDSSNSGSEIDICTAEPGCNCESVDMFQSDPKLVVSRSTSDVTTDSQRKRRERKQRPYKSDPFNGLSRRIDNKLHQTLMKNNFLIPKEEDCTSNRSEFCIEDSEEKNFFGKDPYRKINHRLSNISDVSTDSGVIGPDSIPDAPPSPSSSIFSQTSLFETSEGQTCTDADEKSFGDLEYNQEKHEKERRETILEIRDTEINYGRDLKILKEEFYKPMKNNGLLTCEQLDVIFQNLEELIDVNKQFTDRLQQTVEAAIVAGDELLSTVVIGDLFLKSTNLIYTFEHYCVNQSLATILLEQLEREKDILRIFLKVCQDEHPILRRMHLKSFLMVPVQRIMKYPLLLERLHRATSPNHHDKEAIMNAKTKIEKILEQINSKTRTVSQIRSIKRKSTEKKYTVTEKIEVTRVAMEVLGWHKQDVCDILTSQMQVAPLLSDQNWATKRLRNIKFTSVHAVLLTLGQGELLHAEEECLLFPKRSQVIQAAIVLIKEKNGKFQTFREPFMLNRCIINVDREMDDIFEVMELNKESCLFKSEDSNLFKLWLQNVKQQTLDLGAWRKRRNALPNIMIKHLV